MYLCNIKQRKPNEELLDWRGNWRFRWHASESEGHRENARCPHLSSYEETPRQDRRVSERFDEVVIVKRKNNEIIEKRFVLISKNFNH